MSTPVSLNQWATTQDEAVQGIARLVGQSSKLMELLPMVVNSSLTFSMLVETSAGGIAFRRPNEPFAKTQPSVKSPVSETLMMAGSTCAVDTEGNYLSNGQIMAEEIASKSLLIGRTVDSVALNGLEGTAEQPVSFIGLRGRCIGEQEFPLAANGGPLTLAALHNAKDAVEDAGNGKILICNQSFARDLKNLVIAAAGGASVADLTNPIPTYEGMRIIVVERLADDRLILEQNETRGTSNVCSSAYILAPGSTDRNSGGVRIILGGRGIHVTDEGVREQIERRVVSICFGLSVANKRSAARISGYRRV